MSEKRDLSNLREAHQFVKESNHREVAFVLASVTGDLNRLRDQFSLYEFLWLEKRKQAKHITNAWEDCK